MDPDDISAGVKGYLKCDIAVIGKGDSIKVGALILECLNPSPLPTSAAYMRVGPKNFLVCILSASVGEQTRCAVDTCGYYSTVGTRTQGSINCYQIESLGR